MLPFSGSFLKPSTEDEMVKISKTTNVIDKIDFIDNMFVDLDPLCFPLVEL